MRARPTLAQFLEVITWTFITPPDVQHQTLDYDDHVGKGGGRCPGAKRTHAWVVPFQRRP